MLSLLELQLSIKSADSFPSGFFLGHRALRHLPICNRRVCACLCVSGKRGDGECLGKEERKKESLASLSSGDRKSVFPSQEGRQMVRSLLEGFPPSPPWPPSFPHMAVTLLSCPTFFYSSSVPSESLLTGSPSTL